MFSEGQSKSETVKGKSTNIFSFFLSSIVLACSFNFCFCFDNAYLLGKCETQEQNTFSLISV